MAWLQEVNAKFDRNLNSFYILIESKEAYTQTSELSFRNKLNKQYNLSGNWVVALCDLQLYTGDLHPQPAGNTVYIFCDIITETQIGKTDEQLLRRVPIRDSDISKGWLVIDFQTPYYIPLKITTLTEIGIRIK